MTAVRDLLRALKHTRAPSEAEVRRLVGALEGKASPAELLDLMVLLDSPELSSLLSPGTRGELLSFLGGQNQADAVFKVLDLVPDLSALQLPESVPDKLAADLQLVKSALLDPTLSSEQKQTRVFEFVIQYVRKFVELAEAPASEKPAPAEREVGEKPDARQLANGEKHPLQPSAVPRSSTAAEANHSEQQPQAPAAESNHTEQKSEAPKSPRVLTQTENGTHSSAPRESSSRSPFETQELPRPEQPRNAPALTPEAREREATRMGDAVRASGVDTVLATTQQTVSSLATELSQARSLPELQQRVDQIPLPRPPPSSPVQRDARVEAPPPRREVRGTQLRLGSNTLWNVLHRFRGQEVQKSALEQDAWDRTVALGLLALLGLAVLITVLLTL